MSSDFKGICQITDAAYQASLGRMRKTIAEEAALRETLADLDRQLKESLDASADGQTTWRALGADEAWRKWLVRRKSEVNMQLSRLLVRRAELTEETKRNFARNQVSEQILELQREEARQEKRRRT